MSFQGTLDDLSMKHYMYERIGNVGLTISTASFVLAYEISFETTWRVVGGIVPIDDERVI